MADVRDVRAELARLATGQHDFAEFLRSPSGSLSLTIARWPIGSTDDQQPHTEDEVYHVVAGTPHQRGLMELTPHAKRNRAFWNELSDRYQAEQGRQLAIHGAAWGVWQIPEAELRVLGEVDGRDVLELGCGAAQWSIWLAAHGARAVGLDVSDRQLEHARRLVEAAGVEVQLVHASAEAVPLPGDRFDIVFADHGAMVFADPYRTVPEASRLLRDGGIFAFSMHTPLAEVCWPADQEEPIDRLANDYFGMHRVDVGDSAHVEFQLTYGDWIRLFRANGLEVVDLIELRPAEDATSSYRSDVGRAWARRWPLEHIWKLRRQPR